ncbi:hypothetical protein I553_10170 [Mycobacterium xenopi 4042]|uniref:Uncharacterized protein n=1 Tax=Mycobacterium xenopi 4042 TaxID=1299334 RepID=X7ZM78_MYCXE|nr:hypothetical protein I553_10170 [Mycobacterium xenopi 4042]
MPARSRSRGRGLLRGLRAVAPVGASRGPLVGEHQQRGVRTGESGEVAHVDQVADQQRIQPGGTNPRAEIFSTLGMCHNR